MFVNGRFRLDRATALRSPAVNPPPTTAQKLAIVLAFVASALSFAAVAMRWYRDGAIDATPLFGGLLMLALGIGGYRRIRHVQHSPARKG
jgi:hypothetical protein